MRNISPLPHDRNPELAFLLVLTAALLTLAGCERRHVMALHYLNGFVPGSHNEFLPAKIAVLPVGGVSARGTQRVGAIYAADGATREVLSVCDIGSETQKALSIGLADAGLTPVLLDHDTAPADLPSGLDWELGCRVEEVGVDKRFGAQHTIHGDYFAMSSRIKLSCTLRSRTGGTLYSGETYGAEDEPPPAVGHEAFLPLETEPSESLSVAMSRAVGQLLIDPQFRKALPLRPRSATPVPSASEHRG